MLLKYAHDSTLIIPVWKGEDSNTAIHVVNNFIEWSINNCMKCNFSKCKEMVFRKKGYNNVLDTVQNIPQHLELCILGVTFQENCRFSIRVKNKLAAANKCLCILRTLRKEGYCQAELDKLLSTLVLPELMYGIPVYGSSSPELTTIQCFLDRCHKRRYTSSPVSSINCLQKSHKGSFKKLSEWERHPLHHSLPRINPATVELRQVKPTLPTLQY